jgi:methionyl-tRNA synthetase
MTLHGERMSKSRGNFFDPNAMVAALGADGTRYVTLREVPFDRDADVSWDTFLRRYNADLANDFGNLVNRSVSMAGRYLGGERPAPRTGPGSSALAHAWSEILPRYVAQLEACLLHDALAALWDFVGSVNRFVDTEQPWVLAKAAKAGDEEAAARLRDALGDLVEACRVVGLAAAPFLPQTTPRLLAQLGHGYAYGSDGNGGPPILGELAWGAHAADPGTLGAPEPLFPRLDVESAGD